MIPIRIRTAIGQTETWLDPDKKIKINLHGIDVTHMRLMIGSNGQVELDLIPCPTYCPYHPDQLSKDVPVRLIEFEE